MTHESDAIREEGASADNPQLAMEITVARPREAVWEAWVDPQGIASWWVDEAEGRADPGARVRWSFTDFGMDLAVTVREASAPERLHFDVASPDGDTRYLRVFLEEDGGSTRVRIENGPFADNPAEQAMRRGCVSGWRLSLASLRHRLEVESDGERGHVFVMRPVPPPGDRLPPLFDTSAGLDRWLTHDAANTIERLREGDRISFTLGWGEDATGRVLVRTEDELMMSWSERKALLTLKSFATGPESHAIGLDLSAWPLEQAEASRLRGAMEAALERLETALR